MEGESEIVPKISVIIISYNNFHTTTGPCLDSLKSLSGNRWEIIVIDNGSNDGTQEYLTNYAHQNTNIHIHCNSENRGFAGGNNDGVNLASGEIIILLNSDTVVSQEALLLLSKKLIDHDDWCMIGPMTNEAGNEQLLYVNEREKDKIIDQGKIWCENSKNSHIETDSLVFFCVAMRRTFYTKLGGLDEGYGVGFFEDADFCVKAMESGKKLVIAEDVFIYHQGSASFSQLVNIKNILRKNKKIFIKKNSPSKKMKHVREKVLDVMRTYTREIGNYTNYINKKSIIYRFENRMSLAIDLMPKSFIKRFFYKKKLKKVKTSFTLAKEC